MVRAKSASSALRKFPQERSSAGAGGPPLALVIGGRRTCVHTANSNLNLPVAQLGRFFKLLAQVDALKTGESMNGTN